jgi:hypothetical protein
VRSPMALTAMASEMGAALARLVGGDVRHTLTFSQARRLSTELLARGAVAWPAEVRDWPIGAVRDSLLWCASRDRAGAGDSALPPLEKFIEGRSHLRRCWRCGCTDDNACIHPGTGSSCRWIAPDLCSECQGKAPIEAK